MLVVMTSLETNSFGWFHNGVRSVGELSNVLSWSNKSDLILVSRKRIHHGESFTSIILPYAIVLIYVSNILTHAQNGASGLWTIFDISLGPNDNHHSCKSMHKGKIRSKEQNVAFDTTSFNTNMYVIANSIIIPS